MSLKLRGTRIFLKATRGHSFYLNVDPKILAPTVMHPLVVNMAIKATMSSYFAWGMSWENLIVHFVCFEIRRSVA